MNLGKIIILCGMLLLLFQMCRADRKSSIPLAVKMSERFSDQSDSVTYEKLNVSSEWQLQFYDSCSGDWQDKWFLDGLRSKVEHSAQGMNLIAGPVNRDDAHHTVLWTKDSFKGDLKIQYNYTRTDSQIINVNILYLQATGIGTNGFDEDISKWNQYREVPTMSKYYYNMNPLHISYAAFSTSNQDLTSDYIRVRKYPAEIDKFGETEIHPAYFNTDLFIPDETYQITVIKTKSSLHFNVVGKNIQKLFSWNLQENQAPIEGRIGLRHMYTRSARYNDFQVFTK